MIINYFFIKLIQLINLKVDFLSFFKFFIDLLRLKSMDNEELLAGHFFVYIGLMTIE